MMIESDGPGGAEMMVFRLAQELRRRGHMVLPVGPRKGTGWMGNMFREAGVLQETFWLKRPLDPGCVTRLRQLFLEHQIDVVHSHEFTMGVYGAAAAGRVRIPQILTVHGGFTATKTLRRRVALRWAIRRSAGVAAVSKATRQEFAQNLGLRETAFAVVHNGVPSSTGNAEGVRREFGCEPGELVILAVGNLDRNKNHRMLLEALAILKRRALAKPWRLIIAGGRGGDERELLTHYAKDNWPDERVRIALGRSDIADLQALADVFVMPSLWEGLPMALLEAMVAGNAIVASETAGIPEAIVNGREGILVPPGDLESLVEALSKVLSDDGLRLRLGAAALARANREFTVEVMTDRYEAMYYRAAGIS